MRTNHKRLKDKNQRGYTRIDKTRLVDGCAVVEDLYADKDIKSSIQRDPQTQETHNNSSRFYQARLAGSTDGAVTDRDIGAIGIRSYRDQWK